MILTGEEIKKEVKRGRICISPFIEENVNPNSYNYRLGRTLFEIKKGSNLKKPLRYRKIKLTERGSILEPGKLYLGHTFERIGSDFYVTILSGRSSVGRLGLYLQITADLGHVGSEHAWTLELHAVQPLMVYPLMKIGQVSFWTMHGSKKLLYRGEYGRYSKPRTSKIYKELNRKRP
ncbi:MAG: 2'-deoxycytidine 5'-triphosphate deaminase [Candidatus Brennerbacteria bacterium]|nr:2'-deoxycytidine 5'-triphosphate deaminase [Candidatus Brennerbacteria bacterium]